MPERMFETSKLRFEIESLKVVRSEQFAVFNKAIDLLDTWNVHNALERQRTITQVWIHYLVF